MALHNQYLLEQLLQRAKKIVILFGSRKQGVKKGINKMNYCKRESFVLSLLCQKVITFARPWRRRRSRFFLFAN